MYTLVNLQILEYPRGLLQL